MTNLISSIVIEDAEIGLDNEIVKFISNQTEVACNFSQKSATLIAIGQNAAQVLSKLKQ
jgi:hypothetical protein